MDGNFAEGLGKVPTILVVFAARALWTYNRMREHDGLRPVSRFPDGTRSEICQ